MDNAASQAAAPAAHTHVLAVHKPRVGLGRREPHPLPAPPIYAPRPERYALYSGNRSILEFLKRVVNLFANGL